MAKADLSAARLRELTNYNEETGEFTSAKRPNRVIGFLVPPKNYVRVLLDGYQYYAHRLAWLYVYGEWPKQHIDHINGIKTDNRIANLRDVSPEVNQQNWRQATSWNKTSGLLGVCWNRRNGRWMAQISIKNRTRVIGAYSSAEEAHAAYIAAKRKLHEGCTI